MKQYIYACKCRRIVPHFEDYLRKVNEWHSVEKYNAMNVNKLKVHMAKWYPYTNVAWDPGSLQETFVKLC